MRICISAPWRGRLVSRHSNCQATSGNLCDSLLKSNLRFGAPIGRTASAVSSLAAFARVFACRSLVLLVLSTMLLLGGCLSFARGNVGVALSPHDTPGHSGPVVGTDAIFSVSKIRWVDGKSAFPLGLHNSLEVLLAPERKDFAWGTGLAYFGSPRPVSGHVIVGTSLHGGRVNGEFAVGKFSPYLQLGVRASLSSDPVALASRGISVVRCRGTDVHRLSRAHQRRRARDDARGSEVRNRFRSLTGYILVRVSSRHDPVDAVRNATLGGLHSVLAVAEGRHRSAALDHPQRGIMATLTRPQIVVVGVDYSVRASSPSRNARSREHRPACRAPRGSRHLHVPRACRRRARRGSGAADQYARRSAEELERHVHRGICEFAGRQDPWRLARPRGLAASRSRHRPKESPNSRGSSKRTS